MFDFPSPAPVGESIVAPNGASFVWDGMKWATPQNAAAVAAGITASVVNVLDHGAVGNGTTDDTAAIQAVLNTYAGKATVFLPWTGHDYRTGQLTLPSGTDMLLYGTLQALPGLPGGYIVMQNAVNCAIRGFGVIDGNRAAQTAVGGMAGLAISLCAHIRVSGITLMNSFHWPMNVTQSNDVVFDGVTVTGGGAAPEFAAQCDSCWLTNCILDGTNNGDYVFCFYGGVTNSGAIGNITRNGGAGTAYKPPGMGVLSDDAQPLPCHNIVIANNITYGNGGPGISVLGCPGNISTGIVIANNRSYNNSKNGDGGVAGADIFVDYATDVTITGNSSSANGNSAGPYYTGIFLGPYASSIKVSGNQVFNIGQGLGPATGGNYNGGLYMFNNNDVHVSDNWFYDSQTTPSMVYSVVGGCGQRCSFAGNRFDRPFNCGLPSDTAFANFEGQLLHLRTNTVLATASPQMITNNTSVARWYIGQDSGTESGSNTGSNFEIVSVNDAGTSLLLQCIGINRATGLVTLGNGLVVNGAGIAYGSGASIALGWTGSLISAKVNGIGEGHLLNSIYSPVPFQAVNDAAAAAGNVPVGGAYRNGSVLMVRTV